MKYLIQRFLGDESGAVTVDWIVITAALVAMAIALLGTIEAGALTTVAGYFIN